MKHWCGLGVLVVGLAMGCASTPKQDSLRSDIGQLMMDYYKAPDPGVVESVLESLDQPPISTNPSAQPGFIGFLAEIFEANPERVPAILAREYSSSAQAIIAISLCYSGEAERAAEYLKRNGWAQDTVDDFGRQRTRLEDVVIAHSYDLDLLWGAFFASGDLGYIAKILAFAESPSKLGVPARDVLEITFLSIDIARGDPSGAAAKRLREHHAALRSDMGEEDVNQVFLAATAIWAVSRNATRHPIISDYLTQRIASSRDSARALPLQWALFHQAYPDRSVLADGARVLVMMLTVRSEEAAKALVQDWSVENLEVGGTKELERGTSPIVLMIIQNKLRCEGEYQLVVTEPGGAIREYPNSPLNLPGAGSSFQYNISALDPDHFRIAGSYEYSLRISACGDDLPPISNGFFVY